MLRGRPGPAAASQGYCDANLTPDKASSTSLCYNATGSRASL